MAEDITKRVHPLFYLDAQIGCYSASYISVQRIPMRAIYKIYPISCFKPHHYEVYWSGEIDFRERKYSDQGKRVLGECVKKNTYPTYYRNKKSYNYSSDEEVFIGNWIADLGPEYRRYKNRIVCYVVLGTKSTRFIKEVDRPLIGGIEKYVS